MAGAPTIVLDAVRAADHDRYLSALYAPADKRDALLALYAFNAEIAGVRDLGVESLADFYRKLWSSGPAGTEIPIEIVRDGRSFWVRVRSADRGSYLKKPRLH